MDEWRAIITQGGAVGLMALFLWLLIPRLLKVFRDEQKEARKLFAEQMSEERAVFREEIEVVRNRADARIKPIVDHLHALTESIRDCPKR